MATFQEAIKWLEEGKKVKRSNWKIDGDAHLFMLNETTNKEVICYDGNIYRFDYDDIKTKNWKLYKIKK